MQRVLVIGSGGAGKSTLATRLASSTGLPLVHLDRLYWQAEWVAPSERKRPAILRRLGELRPDQDVIVLRSAAAVEDFLRSHQA